MWVIDEINTKSIESKMLVDNIVDKKQINYTQYIWKPIRSTDGIKIYGWLIEWVTLNGDIVASFPDLDDELFRIKKERMWETYHIESPIWKHTIECSPKEWEIVKDLLWLK